MDQALVSIAQVIHTRIGLMGTDSSEALMGVIRERQASTVVRSLQKAACIWVLLLIEGNLIEYKY